ncbi:MAG: restriction endonuclease subunit S [Bacteroidaceae bacterium]|nr:restriction endonuclease subunit S [Bacteroidaceae bacterium]
MRKAITIGDLGTIITGKTPPTTNKNYYGDYAVFIKPTDISEQSKYTYETEEMYSKLAAEKYESSLIPKGAICIPCIGTIGTKMTMAPCACYTNQSINSIVCNENYDNEYVYYLIKNFLPGLKSYNLGTASGREYVSKSNFEKIELVAEQNIEIQKKIGIFLSRYDSLIENYQKQIKLLEEAAQRLYKEWFVDLRFPGHETTKIVDGLPEGWEEKAIMDVFEFKYGKILPTKDFVEDGPIPVYGASKQIGRYTKANCFEPKVLIGSRGNAGFVHRTIEDETYVTNNSFIVEPTKEYTFLRLPYIYESFKAMDFVAICTGAAQPQLTLNSIASLKYIVPTKKLITIYCDVSISFFSTIAMSYKQIRLLTEARDRLLPKLMSGEIEV